MHRTFTYPALVPHTVKELNMVSYEDIHKKCRQNQYIFILPSVLFLPGCLSVAGLTNRNQQPSTLIFINMVYLELPINLMCMLVECWRKYLERTLTGKDKNMQTPNPPIYMS